MAGRKPVTAECIASQTRAIRIVWGDSTDLSLSAAGTRRETVTLDDGAASLEEAKAKDASAASAPVSTASGSRIEIDGILDRQADSGDVEAVDLRLRLEIITDRGRVSERLRARFEATETEYRRGV